MDKTLTVSVACYNVEKYISTVLESLSGTDVVEDLEVIVVNDGSTDGSAAVVRQYVERYPNVFRLVNKENGGWGSTINTSIKQATGKYFKILDGDDWFDKERLPLFIATLKERDEDLVFSKFTVFYDDGSPSIVKEQDYQYNKPFDACMINKMNMHALAVKTDVLKNNGVNLLEHCFYTDLEFFVRSVYYAKTAVSLPINVYCYRLGREGQSVSFVGYMKHVNDHERVVLTLLSLMKNNPKFDNIRKNTSLIALHLGVLTLFKPTRENKSRFLKFVKNVKNEFPNESKGVGVKYGVLMKFPSLLYGAACRYRRKKLGIKV